MIIRPICEPRIPKMDLEKYADIAIDGGVWLVGEVLAQGLSMFGEFAPDTRYVYKPRHREAAIIELRAINEELRHRIFIKGFLRLPDNGAQATFQQLCETHAEMLHDALRTEWTRRHGKMIGDNKRLGAAASVEIDKRLRAKAVGAHATIEMQK
jgi:hypothetical protein